VVNPKYEVLSSLTLPSGVFDLRKGDDGLHYIYRKGTRGGIPNKVHQYTHISADGITNICPITPAVGLRIIKRLNEGEHFSSAFLFSEVAEAVSPEFVAHLQKKSEMDERYTSTGAKLWKHQQALENYQAGRSSTVISTHISPEGRCNLACPYCSVTYRQNKSRLEMDLIRDYVEKLQSRGLRAAILTGGGEPSLYPKINELIEYLLGRGLRVAMITNGTNLNKLDWDLVGRLTWMRVSVNIFDGWESRIRLPKPLPEAVTLGMSFIYTPQHEADEVDLFSELTKIKQLADRLNARYIRLLPNCLLDQESLLREHVALSQMIGKLNDTRFFHQGKIHAAPQAKVCHQSYFRPYLSEEPFPGTDKPGTVFPCDSIVLNQDMEHFNQKFALCLPADILEYIDRKVQARFDPRNDCTGCVFTNTVNMLDRFVMNGENKFADAQDKEIDHVDFV
jgi:organic radical activating enzyme